MTLKPWTLRLNRDGHTELRVGRANRRVWFVVELMASRDAAHWDGVRVTGADRKPLFVAARDGLRLGRLLVSWDRPVVRGGGGAGIVGDAGCSCGRVGCDGSRVACVERWK